MTDSAERGLLERATIALERQEKAFEGMLARWDESDARADERHRQLLERQERGERIHVSALSEINTSLQRNTDRLDDMGGRFGDMGGRFDDMGDAIRANTRAVLAVLDRLEPRSG